MDSLNHSKIKSKNSSFSIQSQQQTLENKSSTLNSNRTSLIKQNSLIGFNASNSSSSTINQLMMRGLNNRNSSKNSELPSLPNSRSSNNTNSSSYLHFDNRFLDFASNHYELNDHPSQYGYLNNTNQLLLNNLSALDYQLNQLNEDEDDCKNHQYEEPSNLIKQISSRNTTLNRLKYSSDLHRSILSHHSLDPSLHHNKQSNQSQTSFEMSSSTRANSCENSDESVLSMESDVSEKRIMRKNLSNNKNGSLTASNQYSLSRSNTSRRCDAKELSELQPNSSDCSLSKSNIDTVSSNVPGSSTATIEADARFLSIMQAKYGSNKNYENDKIYGMTANMSSKQQQQIESLAYGNISLTEENIYNSSVASTNSASNALINCTLKNGTSLSSNKYSTNTTSNNSNNGNKSNTLPSNHNSNLANANSVYGCNKHDTANSQTTTGPLLPSNTLTSQMLVDSSNYHHQLSTHHLNPYARDGFKMLNSRFSFSLSKNCDSNRPCYWRITSFVLIVLCLTILAFFIYKQASQPIIFTEDVNKPCILVDDYNNVGQVPIFPPPQFTPKQQIDHKNSFPSSSPETSDSPSLSKTNTRTPLNPNSINLDESNANLRPNTVNLIQLPSDPSIYKSINLNTPSSNVLIVQAIALHSIYAAKFTQQTGSLIRFNLRYLPVWSRLAFFARRNQPPTLTVHELVEFISADGSTNPTSNNPSSNTNRRTVRNALFTQSVHQNDHKNKSNKIFTQYINFQDYDYFQDNNFKLDSYQVSNLNFLSNQRSRRSSSINEHSVTNLGSTVSIEYLEYFEPGQWFFVLINDALHDQQFTLHLNITKLTSYRLNCNENCNGHGVCEQGKCVCDVGWTGIECNQNMCPILCSGNGQYIRGICICNTGWTGRECETKSILCSQAENPCNGNGICAGGKCTCNLGYRGYNCEQVDIDLTSKCTSSENGSSLLQVASLSKTELDTCVERCVNGHCSSDGLCSCNSGFTGRFCTLPACSRNCSQHGQCIATISSNSIDETSSLIHTNEYYCACAADWTGPDCSFRFERNCADDIDNDNDGLIDCADSECCTKDECKDSLMCLTSPDPLDIVLRKQPPSVSATFYQKTKFLIEESSVQSYAHRDEYSESEFWNAFDDSRVSVIRGQIVTPDGNGLTGIRISVATDPQFGFTLTRPDGWFDILVNGGAMVTLQFQRSPFHPIKHTTYVACNEIVVMQSPIIMSVVTALDDNQNNNQANLVQSQSTNLNLNSIANAKNNHNHLVHQQQYTLETIFWPYTGKHLFDARQDKHLYAFVSSTSRTNAHKNNASIHCWFHNYDAIKPLIINQMDTISKQGNIYDQNSVTLEDRSLNELYKIPSSDLQLVYQSTSSSAYLSLLQLQLTSGSIPKELILIHLRIVVEGVLFTKEFEAEQNLRYIFSWNKRNVYRQKVYGLANAKIYVGYEYEHCQHIIWTSLSDKMPGFQMDISDLGGWNLQIHHRLNLNNQIIQLGGGGSISLLQNAFIKEVYGEYGKVRSYSCYDKIDEDCKLYLKKTVSLTSGADGSIYIADDELIKRLKPDGKVIILLRLNKENNQNLNQKGSSAKNQYTYNYYLHYSTYDNHLYLSNPERYQILRILNLDNVEQIDLNYEIVAGNGFRCLHLEDASNCGDGGLAIEARLSQPKGLVFSTDNSMYFADGTSVRRINRKGVIFTIIGANLANHKLRPINCDFSHDHITRLSARKTKLNWPTYLAINPLNNLLYILDEGHVIYELTADHRLRVIVGRPAHCTSINTLQNEIGLINSFAFTSIGDVYISVIFNGLHQIKLRTTDGSIKHFLGEQISLYSSEEEYFTHNEHYDDEKQFKFDYRKETLINHLKNCLVNSNLNECNAFLHQTSSQEVKSAASSVKSTKNKLRRLLKINAITVTGDNVLYLADGQNHQILSSSLKLDATKEQSFYYVVNSLSEEIYVFNKHGLHTTTMNSLTGQLIYIFNYDVNTAFGKLVSVNDNANNKIMLVRLDGKLNSIITPNNRKIRINLNNKGLLEQLIEENGLKNVFQYDTNGLLISKSDNLDINFNYQYDKFGRLKSIIKPSGAVLNLKYTFDENGDCLIHSKQISMSDCMFSNDKLKNEKLLLKFNNKQKQTIYTNGIELHLMDMSNSNYLISNSEYNQIVHLSIFPHQELINYMLSNVNFASIHKQVVFTISNTTKQSSFTRTQIHWDVDIKVKENRISTDHKKQLPQLQQNSFNEIFAVERALNIEGVRLLSIEYDRTANREIMYNNSRRPFLMIQYDNSSRPIQWLNTEVRLPLNLIYDRANRISGWQQGIRISETFVYDKNGLLVEIKYPDSSSIKYFYTEENSINHLSSNQLPYLSKPSKIVLRSGKEFIYKYDEKSSLNQILTPKPGVKHLFKFVVSLGFYKLIYTPPGYSISNSYVVYFNDQMKPIMEIHPNSYAKIIYRYNFNSNKLIEIVYGGGKVVRDLTNKNHVAAEYWVEGEEQVILSYVYKLSLPVKVKISLNTIQKFYDLLFNYEYDQFARKTLIKVESSHINLEHKRLKEMKFSYNEKTGKLDEFGDFKIIDHHDYLHKQNESLISDGQATFSKVFDTVNHKLKQYSLSIKDKDLIRVIYTLNANNAISNVKRYVKINSGAILRTLQTNYSYDLDEQLIEMKSEREHWRFSYDDNCNLVRIQYLQNAIEITIDHIFDRIANFGDTSYIYNERGYLIQRGEELFSYNNFGLLISVKKLTKNLEINYLYDAKGRLTARLDNLGNRTQYFYGDIKRSHLVTYIFEFNSVTRQNRDQTLITSFIYDDSNMLIAYQTSENNHLNYVICDQSGSPTHVFHGLTGELIKEITRSPFGHILFDSNPAIYLPIGFHGSINEPLISIVFFQGKYVYDTLVGQFLQPNYGQILNAGVIEPKFLSLYRYARNDPVNTDLYSLSRLDKYDLNKWIQHQGIDLSGYDLDLSHFINHHDNYFSTHTTNVEDLLYNYKRNGLTPKQIPSFNYGAFDNDQFNALSYSVDIISKAIILPNFAVNSDLLCRLNLNTMKFRRISFIKKSQLKSDQILEPSRITRILTEKSPFGSGIGLHKTNSGHVRITSTQEANPLRYLVFSKVLNGSELINFQHSKGIKDLFYFVKKDTTSVSEDLSELKKFGNTVNVTINEVKPEKSSENENKNKVDICIELSLSIINIRYDSNLTEERNRLFNKLKKQAISNKWIKEQQLLINLDKIQHQFITMNNLRPLRSRWNEKEKELILKNGFLPGYNGEFYHDIKNYPELADDYTNIILVKN